MVTSTKSKTVEALLAQHRLEAQRLRDTEGDPVEFLGRIVRESFDPESLAEAFQELTEGTTDGYDADER